MLRGNSDLRCSGIKLFVQCYGVRRGQTGAVNRFAAMDQTAGGARARARRSGAGVTDVSAIRHTRVRSTRAGCAMAGVAGETKEPARWTRAQMPQ